MGTRIRIGGCLALLAVCRTAAAEPERQGFTGDLGLGAALTSAPVSTTATGSDGGATFTYSKQTREIRFGLASLSVSLGGFFTPNVALLFRVSGTSFFYEGDQYSHSFYGPVVEVWPHDRFYLSGGAGLALFGTNPFLSGRNDAPEGGWALDFRAGVALINSEHHDLTLSVEAIPGFYDGDNVQGYALVAAWKWY